MKLVVGLSVGDFDEMLAEQAQGWLSDAAVPADVVARSHVSFADAFADGLLQEVARLEGDAIVVGGSGSSRWIRRSATSVATPSRSPACARARRTHP